MLLLRRDRLLLVLALSALLGADIYFHLWPEIQVRLGRGCVCEDSAPLVENATVSSAHTAPATTRYPGSKLQDLFSHHLYLAMATKPLSEDQLLNTHETVRYQRKRVASFNRQRRSHHREKNGTTSLVDARFDFHSPWLKFHLGISKQSLYPRSSPVVEQLLERMSNLSIIGADYSPDEKALDGECDCSQTDNVCFFSKCLYSCKTEYAVCGDPHMIEASLSAFLPSLNSAPRISVPNPWIRSYSFSGTEEWEVNPSFCDSVKRLPPYSNPHRLLAMMDLAIFDFLMGNMDRHHYEIFTRFGDEGFLLHLDNARGFGRHSQDEISILAPLSQCCLVKADTWQRLNLLALPQYRLSDVMRESLRADPLDIILTEPHLTALDRRLQKVLEVVQQCVQTYGEEAVLIKDTRRPLQRTPQRPPPRDDPLQRTPQRPPTQR
ncbi:pseudokinase FAM20A isoform 3-T3 [Anomaloglossus baeobatrachus]|uniref:pseudokinase FAM20A isoform X3 n=1 Tax=Anomaloglossus baeobatrachus TaxID=238106 RepID=UPI003F4FD86C